MAWEHIKMDPSRTSSEWFSHCRRGILDQMEWALQSHGIPTKDPVRGALNLAEECGEVAAAALSATRPGGVTAADQVQQLMQMVNELNQVAAYAMLLRVSMEGEIRRLQGSATD